MTSPKIQQLCDQEQAFWDNVYDEDQAFADPDDGRWIVRPIPTEHKRFVAREVVAGIWHEKTNQRGDVDYVRRLIDGEWTLVPLHFLDD